MSYFLDTYGIPFSFIGGFIALVILLITYCAIAEWISKRFRLNRKMQSALLGAAVFGAAISLYVLMLHVPDYLNDGRIRNIYIVEKSGDTRLVVWFIREDTPAGMTRVYSHRIKSFDLETGEPCGRLTLSRRYLFNDYTIYGPFDQFAWGYSGNNGMAFLDMFDAAIVADEQEILERNPVLGDKIRLTTGPDKKRFDPVSFGLYMYTANGDIYRIDPDLKASNVKTLNIENQVHDTASCAVCRHMSQFIDIEKATSGWGYDGNPEGVLSYRDKNGRALNTISLYELFDDKRYIYAVARVKGETWLFATMNRYRLSAIRTEVGSGKILGIVDYF